MPFRRPPPCRRAQPRCLGQAMAAVLFPTMAAAAPSVEFDPRFLQGEQAHLLDLARFERGDDAPGLYRADIRVNQVVVARRDVELRATDDGGVAVCLSPEIVEVLGVDVSRLPGAGGDSEDPAAPRAGLPEQTFCDALSGYVPQASVRFDAGEQVLDVSIPQAYLASDPRGWTRPSLWDDGIGAALLGYSLIHQRAQRDGDVRQSTSAVLNAGVNLGPWRVRHDGHFSQSSDAGARYRGGRTYAQRSLVGWGMELLAGDAGTRGDLFDAVGFRGVSVGSDPRMLPESQRDYAPVVHGVALGNARVILRQRGQVVYQTQVATGPFRIDDLSGTAYAGDIDVEVIEDDGRVQRFSVPFATVPHLLRAGQQRFSATAGVLRDAALRRAPAFLEATVRRGVDNRFTGYGGITAAAGYHALLAGGAFNTPLGAFSGDVTAARTLLPGTAAAEARRLRGQSYRLSFSRHIAATDTQLSMAAYRYASAGYLGLAQASRLRGQALTGSDADRWERSPRSRMDLAINQRLGRHGGSLHATGSRLDYRDQRQPWTRFTLGYANVIGRVSYSLSAQRSLQGTVDGGPAHEGNSVHFTLAVPLGGRAGAPRLATTASGRSDGPGELRSGLSGGFGAGRQGSYHLAAGRHGGQGTRYDAGIDYQAARASLSAGYGQSPSGRTLNLGASGGVVLHGDGLSLAQRLGDTVALVHVPDAAGAAIDSAVGVRTDARGYAVVPHMTPFRRNEVTIDPRGLPLEVELKTASVTGIPTAGAVVRLVVPTQSGRTALIEAPQADGTPLPFGLDVRNEAGEVVGEVGQASRLWVRGVAEKGRLVVRWGEAAAQQCSVDFDLTGAASGELLAGRCLPPQAAAPLLPPPVPRSLEATP